MASFKIIRALVDLQAEDSALWAEPIGVLRPVSEAYILQELRRLHAVVEATDEEAERLIEDYEPVE